MDEMDAFKKIELVKDWPGFTAWCMAQAETYQQTHVLMLLDKGVVWGAFQEDEMKLSSQVFQDTFAVQLSPEQLQQAFLFGKKAEIKKPYTVFSGQTVGDVCRLVHQDFYDSLQFARLWRHGGKPMTVSKHELVQDEDVIELHL